MTGCRSSPEAGGGILSNSDDGRSVTSKLAAILRTFSTGSVHSLSDIARSANLPVSTAHRLTHELAEWGFLERTDDKRYRVGTLVAHLGARVWHEPSLQEHARRVLEDLSSATRASSSRIPAMSGTSQWPRSELNIARSGFPPGWRAPSNAHATVGSSASQPK